MSEWERDEEPTDALELLDIVSEQAPEEPEPTYSIIGRAGGSLQREIELADSHLRRIARLERERDAKLTIVQAAKRKLDVWRGTQVKRYDQLIGRHEFILQEWCKRRRPEQAKKHQLQTGEVGMVKTPRRLAVNEAAVQALLRAVDGAGDWLVSEGFVEYAIRLNGAKLLQACKVLEDGTVVRKDTGEVVPPVVIATGEDGETVTVPIIDEADPAGERLQYSTHIGDLDTLDAILEQMDTEEDETDGDGT